MVYMHMQELQHFADLGRLSASMLHEISNPLSAAMLDLELGDQTSPAVRKTKRDLQLLRRYVEAARQQIRAGSQLTVFSLQPQLCQLKMVLLPMAKRSDVQLEFGQTPPNCKMYGDPVIFQHIVANLIVNAIQAYDNIDTCTQASRVQVNLGKNQNWLTLRVTDWGEGITAPELPNLFDAFYTTKNETSHGLGIGLATVKQYVTNDFGGSIKVSSSKCHGTQFTIRLRILPH